VTPPEVVRTRDELAAARGRLPGRVAVVMTMGALHAGHGRLIELARDLADDVIVTVFLNPLQFGPGEDLDRYPKTFEADLALCAEHGATLVFAPTASEMYPPDQAVETVSAGELGRRLEGAVRPTHFDGVLTVVAMLLRMTRPDVAVFGEKDAQQLALIRRMVTQLSLPVDVHGVEIVRDPSGLALSSRNRYLTDVDRETALALSRSLQAGLAAAGDGIEAVRAAVTATLAQQPEVGVDYVAVIDERTWQDADEDTTAARILVAGRVGTTRLIDNASVVLGHPAPRPAARLHPAAHRHKE
jgi:pantoate--beta-alanine ligase